MCGILGVFRASPQADDQALVKEGLRQLLHRGPDASGLLSIPACAGVLYLAHARLSIIDLSDAARQPMASADGRHLIVFNGEIYNYRELRHELAAVGHRFLTDSDTEVLLSAWIQWGVACLPRLVGMFAFAVFDRDRQALTCVRDAFGIKPLFYACDGEDFLFASEIPALLRLRSGKPTVNWQRAFDYLVHGEYEARADTMVQGVRHLLPGHVLTLDISQGLVSPPARWWVPSIEQRTSIGFSDAAQQVREGFLRSVQLNLRSDVPLGAALSGGVDSSAVVCAMRHLAPDMPIHTFSFVARGTPANEEAWIDAVNQHVGAQSHKVVITPAELKRDLDDLILAQGEPFGSLSIYAQYRVYQLAKEQGITVTLDGQGADEMLGGYQGFPGERVHSLVDAGRWLKAWGFLSRWSRWPGRSMRHGLRASIAELGSDSTRSWLRRLAGLDRLPEWVKPEVIQELQVRTRFDRFHSAGNARGRRLIAQQVNMLTTHGLPALLRHGDRNSMQFAVESRVPFLSLDFVELMLGMPESYLVSDQGQTKHVFRHAMQGIVPSAVLYRRDKIGFEPPEKQLIVSMADEVKVLLKQDVGIPFLRSDILCRHFDEMVSGARPFSWQAWRWINFYKWKLMIAG